ncbi:MAG: cation:proton antiporter [Thermoplasmata archaeon]
MEEWIFLTKMGLLILLGFGGYKLARMTGVFGIPIYLGIGILFGHFLLGFKPLAFEGITEGILHICVAFILFNGGFDLSLEFIKKNLRLIFILTTVGLLITALVTGYATSLILSWPIIYGLLFGSMISETDPATLIPLFEDYPVKEKIKSLLVSESGYNDPTGAVLTSALLTAAAASGGISIPSILIQFVQEAGIGIIFGAGIGVLGSLLIKKISSKKIVLIPVIVIIVLSSYFSSHYVGGSGFMGAITAGLFLKIGGVKFDSKFESGKEDSLSDLSNYPSLIGRIAIFVILGALVQFSDIESIGLLGLLVVGTLMFVGRPLTVVIGTFLGKFPKFRESWSWKELGFLSWTGNVRGVMPATLAGIIVVRGISHGYEMAGLTFVTVLITILVQASTTPILIKKWKLD